MNELSWHEESVDSRDFEPNLGAMMDRGGGRCCRLSSSGAIYLDFRRLSIGVRETEKDGIWVN